LAIIGKPNVGKSTLINRMLGEDRVIVYDKPGTTRDSISIPLERHGKKYTLIDTAGIRKRGKVFEVTEKFSIVKTLQAIESAHVVLFIMDAHEGVSDQDLKLLGFILDSGKAIVIALAIDRRLQFLHFARIHFISALHGTAVGNLFPSVEEAYLSANKKVSTPKINIILKEIITKHAPPMIKNRRVKLRYAHIGGHNPPLIIVHGNQVTSLPDSYHRYLANAFQERLELVGTQVKIEFRQADNPYRLKRNPLTPRQERTLSKLAAPKTHTTGISKQAKLDPKKITSTTKAKQVAKKLASKKMKPAFKKLGKVKKKSRKMSY
jgi:GTP-binding protein